MLAKKRCSSSERLAAFPILFETSLYVSVQYEEGIRVAIV